MKNYEVKKELKKWDERVIFNVAFKPNTKANLERLDEINFLSLEHFITLAANSEPLVYKIGRYFIEKGIKNDNITFIDGKIVESYIGDESAEWKKKERADEFFKIFGDSFKGKWVLIPYMSFSISIGLAIYFITHFKKSEAIGVIFYAEGPENMTETISLNSDDPFFIEYPIKKYRRRKRKIEDDEW